MASLAEAVYFVDTAGTIALVIPPPPVGAWNIGAVGLCVTNSAATCRGAGSGCMAAGARCSLDIAAAIGEHPGSDGSTYAVG